MNIPIPDLTQRVIFEDDQLLLINKPHNIPTAGRSLDDADGVQYWLIQRAQKMIWVVNQLDADTTGLNLFVKEKKLVSHYMDILSHPQSHKEYFAVIHGNPTWNTIEDKSPLGYVDARSLGVCKTGKSAHSLFEVIERTNNFAAIKARIFTGRTHQIRIHLSHLGHPVVGDEWYCRPPCTIHHRQALHAWHLLLQTTPPKKFCAPIPQDLVALGKQLGFTNLDLTS